LVSYLQGNVQHWPQIIETTFKIAHEPYPYGWRYGLSSNNHNNYDVVKIFVTAVSHDRGATRSRPRSNAGDATLGTDHFYNRRVFAPDEFFQFRLVGLLLWRLLF
jgi:hypothetical protein